MNFIDDDDEEDSSSEDATINHREETPEQIQPPKQTDGPDDLLSLESEVSRKPATKKGSKKRRRVIKEED